MRSSLRHPRRPSGRSLIPVVAALALIMGSAGAAQAAGVTVRGVVACPAGQPVTGIWVASKSSGWAAWSAVPGSTSVATYSIVLSTTAPASVQLRVGCGGTPKSWTTTNNSPPRSAGASNVWNAVCGGGSCLWSTAAAGPQAMDQRPAADAARRELGTSRQTGMSQPGECIMSVKRWLAAAGIRMAGGGPLSAYRNSPALQLAAGNADVVARAAKGDVIQYVSNATPDAYPIGVHTVMVFANNGDGTLWIVQSNVPYGSGRVSEVTRWKPAPPAGFTANLWRFGRTG